MKTFFAANKLAIIIAAAVSSAVLTVTVVIAAGRSNNTFAEMPAYGAPQQMPLTGGQYAPAIANPYNQAAGNNNAYSNYGYSGSNNYGAAGYGGYAGGSYNYGGGSTGYNAGAAADYTSGYYPQQKAYDRAAENYGDYIRDQGNYSDGYGNTYKLNSGYDNSYVNTTTNEYIQTNDAGYDPNAYSTSGWTSVSPSSSYSSSTTAGDE